MNRRDFIKKSCGTAVTMFVSSCVASAFIGINTAVAASTEYFITERCIGCQQCANTCPQKAISGSTHPLVINQDACMHCGACFRVCPVQAIINR